jgi:serine/threonine protein kinase
MTIKTGLVIANKYRIDKLISDRGGMAIVYLGSLIDPPNCKVAIKFARGNGNGPVHEEKFLEREAEMLRKWDWRHPGIVRVYPIQLEKGNPPVFYLRAVEMPERLLFMVMEYLMGDSLSANLSTIKRYPLGWKIELFYQLLLAVSPLHQKGFAHRDLKPENIVFRTSINENSVPQPVLIDFALASEGESGSKVVEESYSLAYVAPERILRTMGVTTGLLPPNELASDIWSLGVILYEILTGDVLLQGNENKVRTSVIKGTFKDKVNQNVNPSLLKRYLNKMFDQNPNDRPTIKDIIYALDQHFPAPRL